MKILLVGGGSGGHIFPLIAVQKAINAQQKNMKFIVVTDKISDEVKKQFLDGTHFETIHSGKIRRFAHWKWWQYFYPTRYKFYLMNILDMGKLLVGIMQSLRLLHQHKPTVIFAKGGFVSVPIGLAARWQRIPVVLHESDTRPGLAGRVLQKSAAAVAQGLPSQEATNEHAIQTGIPVRDEFFDLARDEARKRLHFESKKPLLVITGGSLGARRVNQIVVQHLAQILTDFSVIHITGEKDFEQVCAQTSGQSRGDYQVFPFVGDKYPETIVAADIIVARAGATTIAELAAAKKPVIFIPNSYLTDQVSNTRWLESQNAGVVLHEDILSKDNTLLVSTLKKLLSEATRKTLSEKITKLAQRNAADLLATVILETAHEKQAHAIR